MSFLLEEDEFIVVDYESPFTDIGPMCRSSCTLGMKKREKYHGPHNKIGNFYQRI
jgi:hypothetical protein